MKFSGSNLEEKRFKAKTCDQKRAACLQLHVNNNEGPTQTKTL